MSEIKYIERDPLYVVAPSTVNKKGEIYVRHGFFKFKKKNPLNLMT